MTSASRYWDTTAGTSGDSTIRNPLVPMSSP